MAISINGSGTVTGISVGGLPDGIVDTDMLAADAVTGAKVADDAVGSEHIEQLDSNLQIDRDKYIGTVASGQSTINIGTSGGSQIGFHKINTNDDELRFYTHTSGVAHTERMRLSSGGSLLIGRTTATSFGSLLQIKSIDVETNGDTTGMTFNRTDSNAAWVAMRFYVQGSQKGYIQVNTGSVTYSTSSDYRLKENVVSISDGITRLKQLKPYRFNFKNDSSTTLDGFYAHEASEVVPESVVGEKDAVDAEGNIDPQGIDQSKLVPLLTAALQEAVAKIETLETKVAALEAG